MVAGPALLGEALADGSLISSTGRIIGMSAGGVVAAAAGPAVLFIANAVSFAAVIAALLAMHLLPARAGDRGPGRAGRGACRLALPRHPARGARHPGRGLRARQRQPGLRDAGRNYQVTMAAMSFGPLSGGPAGYGVLPTVFAAGTVLGALAAGRFRELRHRLLIGAGLVAGVLRMVAGAAPSLWSFAAVPVPIAAAAVIVDTTVSTRLPLDTREDMRGWVLAAAGWSRRRAGSACWPARRARSTRSAAGLPGLRADPIGRGLPARPPAFRGARADPIGGI
ncbi:hypothetical protein ACQP1P_41805 [Dactylosporangium sp. CA-052675]|uniref:hypothetical protein n=1 Tax=Dactylosporangium sp. CA-052675 TaxID=3239927 RepID=UPI003D922C54